MNKKDVAIATPCTLDWQKMTPADGGRFCGDCKKVVRDLSKLTRAEARKMLMERTGDLCVRYVHDAKGDIFFADMPPVIPASALNRAARAAFAAAVVALQPGCGSNSPSTFGADQAALSSENPNTPPEEIHEVMGGMEYVPPTDDVGTDDTGDHDGGAADVDGGAADVDASDAH